MSEGWGWTELCVSDGGSDGDEVTYVPKGNDRNAEGKPGVQRSEACKCVILMAKKWKC